MRYKLDADGYIVSVAFGCYLDNCAEYTGKVPAGYGSLHDWSENACIQAYYIDNEGNLELDIERQQKLKQKEEQDAIDNAFLLRKDLYGTEEAINSQYVKATASGEVITLKDIRTVSPVVKITGNDFLSFHKLSVYTHGKQMMPCDAVTQTVNGVSFTKNADGSITASGKATKDIEYTVSGSKTNREPLFVLKAGHNYYLNLGGLPCELRYYDGETTSQQYIGNGGLINLTESKPVTEVVIKIDSNLFPYDELFSSDNLFPEEEDGRGVVNTTFYPQLEYGEAFTEYEPYQQKSLTIDWSEELLKYPLPSDTLRPGNSLYPQDIKVDYIWIEKGVVSISINGTEKKLGKGNVGLFEDFDTIYATEDVWLEMEYSTSMYDVASLEFLQGKSTTTNQFKILKDGSIEAHNGYFSGKIEGGSININDKFLVDSFGNVTIPDTATITWGNVVGTKPFITGVTKEVVTASYIDATVGLSATYATIGALNAQVARINTIESNYISASTVKAQYMEVANWTSAGYIRADKINADTIISRASSSASMNIGRMSTSTLVVGGWEFAVEYDNTLQCIVLKGKNPIG